MEWKNIWHKKIITIGDFNLDSSQILTFAFILFLTFFIALLCRKGFKNLGKRKKVFASAQLYMIGRFTHYIIWVIGFVIALSALGIDVSKLALVASALGIGIGLGLQGIVNNFVSGLAILLEKSVKVGDFIELDGGITGEVMEIHMRATLIRTNDNVDILIPNADLTNSKLINWTLEESVRRFRIPFGVAYGTDKTILKKAVLEAADSVSCTLNHPTKKTLVWMTGFGDSSLDFVLAVWVGAENVKRPSSLTSEYLWAIDDALRKYNIEIPFPQRDLHLRSCQTSVHLDNNDIQIEQEKI